MPRTSLAESYMAALGVRIALPDVQDGPATTESGDMPPPSSLFTLDSREIETIGELIESSGRVSLLLRSGINIFHNYQSAFERLLARRGAIRVIVVDPSSQAAVHVYGDNPGLYEENLRSSLRVLQRLADVASKHGAAFSLRTLSAVPPFSMMIAERDDLQSLVRVQINFLLSHVSRDRPVLDLAERDPWFENFSQEFDSLWSNDDYTTEWQPVDVEMRIGPR